MSSLGAKLLGSDRRTGFPVQAAAGSLGSYSDLSPDFYQTFRHDNWQHPGSSGWSSANMPGWGNNPNLQMFSRRAVGDAADGVASASLGVLLFLGVGGFLVLSALSESRPRR